MAGQNIQHPYWEIERSKVREGAAAKAGERALRGWELGEQKRRWDIEQAQQREEWGLGRQSMEQMIREYNRAYGQAAAGEEKRYQEILGIADRTTGQRAADIRADYTEQQSSAMQRLARLGMANTTIAPTMKMGFQREQQSALNRLADQMQQTQIGVRERRPSRFPQTNVMQLMAQQMGRGGTATRAVAPLSGMRQF